MSARHSAVVGECAISEPSTQQHGRNHRAKSFPKTKCVYRKQMLEVRRPHRVKDVAHVGGAGKSVIGANIPANSSEGGVDITAEARPLASSSGAHNFTPRRVNGRVAPVRIDIAASSTCLICSRVRVNGPCPQSHWIAVGISGKKPVIGQVWLESRSPKIPQNAAGIRILPLCPSPNQTQPFRPPRRPLHRRNYRRRCAQLRADCASFRQHTTKPPERCQSRSSCSCRSAPRQPPRMLDARSSSPSRSAFDSEPSPTSWRAPWFPIRPSRSTAHHAGTSVAVPSQGPQRHDAPLRDES